jgi:hypothetical protein
MLKDEVFHIVVTRPRKTKLGDFRHPRPGEVPRLTVNGNLEPNNFLITLVHEVAHLKIWRKHKNTVKPHGDEWKNCYSALLTGFLGKGFFPENLEKALLAHVKMPKYTSVADQQLMRALRLEMNEAGTDDAKYVEDLSKGQAFYLQNRIFVIEEKLRKNYLCKELPSGKKYRVSALARVMPVSEQTLSTIKKR